MNDKGFITVDDLAPGDKIHPGDFGFSKMAAVWANAFLAAEKKGYITAPYEFPEGGEDNGVCEPNRDDFRGPVITQAGSGYDDGKYKHNSVDGGMRFVYNGVAESSLLGHFHYAQLTNIGGADLAADEFIRVLDDDQMNDGGVLKPRFSYKRNLGDGRFDRLGWIEFNPNSECKNRGVRWGDFNGDGLDDFICINQEGNVYLSLNKGGDPPTFGKIDMIRAMGVPQARIRLGDIDGDGRCDLCWFPVDSGNIHCIRNMGIGDKISWQPMEGFDGAAPIFDAQGMPSIDGVRLIDINGDGRYDWVYVYPDGHTKIFINHRGLKVDGPGLKPKWVEAETPHRGFPGELDDSRRILFGRIWGSGRNDLVRQLDVDGQDFSYEFWYHQNTGQGGTRLKGDGVYYCDMFGRGHDDYLWVWSGGEIELFENLQNPPNWKNHGQIYNTRKNRKWIQFGDWDGDGKCDILNTDRNTGDVWMYRNTWAEGKTSPTFADPVKVKSGGDCPQKYSPGLYDLAVRFGDLDGDGRVDYLCLAPDGTTQGWLNKAGDAPEPMNPLQVKVTAGFDRANHRFADVNGDGRADFLWVDKFTGNVRTWINEGLIPADNVGSSMTWTFRGEDSWPSGKSRGQNVHFPKMGNTGRADYHWVNPATSYAETYFNECGGGGDNGEGPDDPIGPRDPQLPGMPIPGFPGGDTGGVWPLLTIGPFQTTVSLDLPTASKVYEYLKNPVCKRASAATECFISINNRILEKEDLVRDILSLYEADPVEIDPEDLEDLPKYSDVNEQDAFIPSAIATASVLGAMDPTIGKAAAVWVAYAIMNLAIKSFEYNIGQDDLEQFSIPRTGIMNKKCPSRDDITCPNLLCEGSNGQCQGLFSGCSCTEEDDTCPTSDEVRLTYLCQVPTCMGDSSRRECTVEDKKGCDCAPGPWEATDWWPDRNLRDELWDEFYSNMGITE
ncbi:unnamed protein product [Periconia digitata]|uniref:Uncharacterized protein n=1 Tax=Periconia digitata TaxID=1303443 RepID=A0A9W4UJF6_9PLEO|nr:unnamed protein product [Periconia digitata]